MRTDWLFSDERPTGLLFRNLSGPAGAEVVYRRSGSAGAALRLDDVLRALDSLGPGGFFVITGVTAAVCGTVAVSAATAAASGGYRVVLDVNLRTRLWTLGDARASIAALVPSATLVVGSAPEAAAIMETDDVEMAAHRLLALGPDMVVLRTSSLSAICYSRSEREPVTVQGTARDPVDVVGAGDAFLAGLLSGLLDLGPDEIEACLGRAHRCGAAAVGAIGDTEGLPTRAELETLEATADGADVRR